MAVLLWFGALLSFGINSPWTGKHEWNGFVWSQAAHNHLRAGLRTTLGVPSWEYFGPLPIPAGDYYVHHPPLMPLMVTAAFTVFGERELAARLVPISCSLVSAMLLWLLVRPERGTRTATLTVAVFACLPMQSFFGRMVNYEPVALMWMLAALFCLRRWQATRGVRWQIGSFAAFFFGMCTEWHVHLFVAVVAGALMLRRQPIEVRMGWALLALAVATLVMFLFHIRLVRADAWQDAWHALVLRLSSDRAMVKTTIGAFSWPQWLERQVKFLSSGLLLPGLALAIAGACYRSLRKREESSWLDWMAASFAIMNVLYLLIWRNASYNHEYASFYLSVPVALFGGVALDALLGFARKLWKAAVFVILAVLVTLGAYETRSLHRAPYFMLEWGKSEPRDLIPRLGQKIAQTLPTDAEILCNFPWYSPQLEYYARHQIVFKLTTHADWERELSHASPVVGGLIWLGDAGADELLDKLPAGTRQFVQFEDLKFCLWKPGLARGFDDAFVQTQIVLRHN